MTLSKIIAEYNKTYDYVADGADEWTIGEDGDCEDYVLSIVWAYSDKSVPKFIWNVLFKFRFHFVTVRGDGHFVGEHEGMFFDTGFRKLVPYEQMIDDFGGLAYPYEFQWRYNKLGILLRTLKENLF